VANQKKKKSGAEKPAPLPAWQQFNELNFSFYKEHPDEFLQMRIEALSLMLCDEQQLKSAYAAERSVKGVRVGATTPPDEEMRRRYIQTEAVMIFHHAAEMILRLYYAHLDFPLCPWLGIASLTNFSELKEKVGKSLEDRFDRGSLSEIFLGGSSPTDACIAMSPEDFEDAIDGVELLLRECGKRFLGEAFLYNSIKHGLSTISLDESTQIAAKPPGQQQTAIGSKGPMFVYLHKGLRPGDNEMRSDWFASMKGVQTETQLTLTLLVARAVSSLWDVAKRRYTGESGSIYHLKRSAVELAIYAMVRESKNMLNTLTLQLVKLNSDGSCEDQPRIASQILNEIPEDFEPAGGFHIIESPVINLPARQRDRRVYSTSIRAYLPFSPKGSQRA
jgi:hypothetical protein